MKSFFQNIQNIFKIEELRNKIIFTLVLLMVYRIGTHIPLPGINPAGIEKYIADIAKNDTSKGFFGILSAFTGGAFTKASLLGLGVMPYITASIIMQLMGMAIPYLQKLQNDGSSGRKTLTQITRYLTVVICLFQAPGYLTLFKNYIVPMQAAPDAYMPFVTEHAFAFTVIGSIILTTGTLFTMWLGEKITDKGIGNGTSLIIMIGIVATLPNAVITEVTRLTSGTTGGGIMMIFIEALLWLTIILLTVLLVNGVRKVHIEYARRVQGNTMAKGVSDFIPLKVNAAGVMPIIFAQAIVMLPVQVGQYFISKDNTELQSKLANFGHLDNWTYNAIFAILIIVFTFFYTAIAIQTNQMADGLKRSGGFVPGIKPGVETANYFDDILSKITFPGSIFLALIAILPGIVMKLIPGMDQNFAMFFGGTSLIIMVGVAIDTVQQINTYLLNHHYDGLMTSGRTK